MSRRQPPPRCPSTRTLLRSWSIGLALATLLGCAGGSRREPTEAAPTPETVSRPPTANPVRLPATFQRGINFDHTGGFDRRLDVVAAGRSLDVLVLRGVDHIAVTPSFFQPTLADTSFVWKRDRAVIDDEIRTVIRLAHGRGLKVLLKPHLWLEQRTDSAWRGRIDPAPDDWPVWERNYRAALGDYARLGRDEGVAGMVIGSELTDLAVGRPEFWRSLAGELRTEFPGTLTYAANWYQEFDRISWWDAVDYIGVDGFWPLVDDPDDPLTAAACAERLQTIAAELQQVAARFDRPVILTEIGYKSVQGAAHRPWEWHEATAGRADPELQALIYRSIAAVFGAAAVGAGKGEPWLAGVYFWQWTADLGWGGPDNTDFTPRGKPAEDVLAELYGGQLRGSPGK